MPLDVRNLEDAELKGRERFMEADKKVRQKFAAPYSEMMAKMFMAQLQADPALAEELRKRKPKEFAEMMAKYGGR